MTEPHLLTEAPDGEGRRQSRPRQQWSFPAALLRVEGAVALALSLLLYARLDESWWLVLVLLLAPDLSILGYLAGPRAGSIAYDLAHTYAAPAVLIAIGLLWDRDLAISLGLIWCAHIGMDRMIGYGFKYPEGFKETHLQRV